MLKGSLRYMKLKLCNANSKANITNITSYLSSLVIPFTRAMYEREQSHIEYQSNMIETSGTNPPLRFDSKIHIYSMQYQFVTFLCLHAEIFAVSIALTRSTAHIHIGYRIYIILR